MVVGVVVMTVTVVVEEKQYDIISDIKSYDFI